MGRPLSPQLASASRALPIRALLDGFEVVQAIQEPRHSVALVSGKRTVIRVYLGVEAPRAAQMRGSLELIGASGTVEVASLNTVSVRPADNGRTQHKREDLARSLNFSVPAQMTAAGQLVVRLKSLVDIESGTAVGFSGAQDESFTFQEGPPLRLRLIGMRYFTRNSGIAHVPSQHDVDLVLSWLERAYPIPRVEASYVVVDANYQGPISARNVAAKINVQLRAIRNQDVANGMDNRTHYYGLVADSGGFMRGRASGIPSSPNPSVVASGPTGPGNQGWDFDGSYGDWYTGHELGHTFGRLHPGFCGGNSRDDRQFPYPNGRISAANPTYVGYDAGDAEKAISPAALPGTQWHDVMTYCSNQWLSAYTYDGIRRRLLAEDALGPNPSGASPPRSDAGHGGPRESASLVNVIATLNLTEQTGRIDFVNPIASVVQQPMAAEHGPPAGTSALIRALDENGDVLSQEPVEVIMDSCLDAEADETAVIDAAYYVPEGTKKLELVFNDVVLDEFLPGPAPSEVTDIQGATPAAGRAVLRWNSGEAADPRVTYTVQVSEDGASWQTIAIGRPTPEVEVDRKQYPASNRLKVRITATNGFHVTSSTDADIELD